MSYLHSIPESDAASLEGSKLPESSLRLAAILEDRRELYETFARTSYFSIELGEKTCFNHRSAAVIIGTEQLLQWDAATSEKIDFFVFHELGHLKELYNDPDGYQEVVNESERSDGLGKVYFRFYNSLADIYCNTNSAQRASCYRGTGEDVFSEDTKDIYRRDLFPERNFTDKPLCQQYMDYLLNLGMDAADDITISPEVRDAVDTTLTDLGGQELSTKELIDRYLRPIIAATGEDSWNATISQRKLVIDFCLRPIFEDLVRIDLERGANLEDIPCVLIPGMDIDPANAKDILKDAKRRQTERNMDPKDKAKRERQRQVGEIAEKEGLTPAKQAEFASIFEKAYPIALELCELWKKIRHSEVTFEPVTEGYYPTGESLDINKAVSEFPLIQNAPDQAQPFNRRVYEEVKTHQPKLIWIIKVDDCSGSMEDDLEKVKVLSVGLGASLAILNQQALQDPEQLTGLLSGVCFNDSPTPLPLPEEDVAIEDIARVFPYIKADGGTSDHFALRHVLELITPEKERLIRDGHLLAFMVEITDGETSNPTESARLVDLIEGKGVKVAGIRFGVGFRPDFKERDRLDPHFMDKPKEPEPPPELQDTKQFEKIWNRGSKIRGHRIRSPGQIISTFYEILSGFIDEAMQ